MTYAELLSSLGLELHLDLSEAVKTGSCTLQLQEGFELTLEYDEPADQLLMLTETMKMPSEDRLEFLSALMQLHLFGIATKGGVFGLDPQQDRILFFQTLSLAPIDQQTALGTVEEFVNQARRWAEQLPRATARLPGLAAGNNANHRSDTDYNLGRV